MRQIRVVVPVVAAIAAMAVAGASWLATPTTRHQTADTGSVAPPVAAAVVATNPLTSLIARTQAHLREVPLDWEAWGTLGLDYVEQAKVTVDPAYYPKAAAALPRSLRLDAADTFIAMAGQAALPAARHDFRGAMAWAQRGLQIDPHNAVLY